MSFLFLEFPDDFAMFCNLYLSIKIYHTCIILSNTYQNNSYLLTPIERDLDPLWLRCQGFSS